MTRAERLVVRTKSIVRLNDVCQLRLQRSNFLIKPIRLGNRVVRSAQRHIRAVRHHPELVMRGYHLVAPRSAVTVPRRFLVARVTCTGSTSLITATVVVSAPVAATVMAVRKRASIVFAGLASTRQVTRGSLAPRFLKTFPT